MLKSSNHEPLVPIKSGRTFLVEPIWEKPIDDIEGPLYQAYIRRHPSYNSVLVRSGVCDRLSEATVRLPKPYKLIIRAGHRPLEVQYALLEMVKAGYKTKNPKATDEVALEFARTYVSDPAVKVPPHCTGSAVDVDVVDEQIGELVDFGCPINTDSEIAHLGTDKISHQQRANRELLQGAMCAAGFATFATEWWHFSYGDRVWADYYNHCGPIYDLIGSENYIIGDEI